MRPSVPQMLASRAVSAAKLDKRRSHGPTLGIVENHRLPEIDARWRERADRAHRARSAQEVVDEVHRVYA